MDATVGVALWLSLKVAGLATLLNIVLGTAAGFALARWRFAGRDVLDTVLLAALRKARGEKLKFHGGSRLIRCADSVGTGPAWICVSARCRRPRGKATWHRRS